MYTQRRPSSRPRSGGYSQRGRSSSSGSGRNFESNGPANFRVRGKPIQIHDKYVQIARDSAANGDKILTENLLQHAEHYLRLQTSDRDKSAPSERNNEPSEEEGDGEHRRFAPRTSGARRRWAVSPEGPARERYASSEPTTSSGEEGGGEQPSEAGQESGEEQAEVEQRQPLSEGGMPADNFSENARNGNERDYSSEASYD